MQGLLSFVGSLLRGDSTKMGENVVFVDLCLPPHPQ